MISMSLLSWMGQSNLIAEAPEGSEQWDNVE